MLAQALHAIAYFVQDRSTAGSVLSTLRAAAARARAGWRRPDRFVRGIPAVSERWLEEHQRMTGKRGSQP